MSFQLLSEAIRRFIRDKGWEELRPIQVAAINRIMSSDDNFILASRTASGKTEAAFLPILSKVNFNDSGVRVLYISPLIALINDQFLRIEELCKYLDVSVTKWHGEANRTEKQRLIRDPKGIVLITPESIEAMFVNKPYNVKALFSNLQYIVIDEIHSFVGTDRGVQLQSLLSRIQSLYTKPPVIVGLSATIGDFQAAKRFVGDEARTKVLLDRTARETEAMFRYFEADGAELPLDLLKNLYLETRNDKVLIFPNSRGRAEEVAVKLKKIAEKVHGHLNYFSHHSSVDREVREYVEHFAKNNVRQSFCISCTSTLELGIDIGTVDEVVQIDATHSIASLIQRVGRSGRKEGARSNLFLYATNEWSLLQSVACWLLYKEGFIEPPSIVDQPFDLLLHQALSIVKSSSGIQLEELVIGLRGNAAFSAIKEFEVREILDYLIELDLLEKLGNEIIVGVDGERLVNNRNFYTVFKTEESFKVIHGTTAIGDVPFSPQIIEGENILLSARIWKILSIDQKSKKILVVSAKDGKKPTFFGTGSIIHQKVREKMLEVLICEQQYEFLDDHSSQALEKLRGDFSMFKIDHEKFRPIKEGVQQIQLFTFTGTTINRTIQLLLNAVGIQSILDDQISSLEVPLSKDAFFVIWSNILTSLENIDDKILEMLQQNPVLMDFSKWGEHLSTQYKVKLLKTRYYNIDATKMFIENIAWVSADVAG